MSTVYEMDLVGYKCDENGTVVDAKPLCHYVHVADIDTYKSILFTIERYNGNNLNISFPPK